MCDSGWKTSNFFNDRAKYSFAPDSEIYGKMVLCKNLTQCNKGRYGTGYSSSDENTYGPCIDNKRCSAQKHQGQNEFFNSLKSIMGTSAENWLTHWFAVGHPKPLPGGHHITNSQVIYSVVPKVKDVKHRGWNGAKLFDAGDCTKQCQNGPFIGLRYKDGNSNKMACISQYDTTCPSFGGIIGTFRKKSLFDGWQRVEKNWKRINLAPLGECVYNRRKSAKLNIDALNSAVSRREFRGDHADVLLSDYCTYDGDKNRLNEKHCYEFANKVYLNQNDYPNVKGYFNNIANKGIWTKA